MPNIHGPAVNQCNPLFDVSDEMNACMGVHAANNMAYTFCFVTNSGT